MLIQTFQFPTPSNTHLGDHHTSHFVQYKVKLLQLFLVKKDLGERVRENVRKRKNEFSLGVACPPHFWAGFISFIKGVPILILNQFRMNNHASRSLLKVDSTCIKADPKNCIIFYNINIPQLYTQDRGELTNVLERIKIVLQRDFGNLSIVYQISASYILKHTESGQTKTWTGSFYAKNHELGIIADFQQLDPTTFVRHSLDQLVNIDEKLRSNGFNTKWIFSQLLSVIFNIQCKVPSSHPIIVNRRHRQHQTFPL